jgi:4-hydroxy-tetrahydrodipicolinate reductase
MGATGRMGQELLKLIEADASLQLSFACSQWSSKCLTELPKTDLVIDFSSPSNMLAAAKSLGEAQVTTLIGTTGFSESQRRQLKTSFGQTRFSVIPNTAPGVYALEQALVSLSHRLGPDFELHVEEIHHSQKKDAPSGTAKRLIAKVLEAQNRKHSTTSLRSGQAVGVHRFVWMGPFERIEVTHIAESRGLFALGALQLGRKLLSLKRAKGEVPAEALFGF